MHGSINFKSANITSKWQMGFNSAFKGLSLARHSSTHPIHSTVLGQYQYYTILGCNAIWFCKSRVNVISKFLLRLLLIYVSYTLLANIGANVLKCTVSCRRSFLFINRCENRFHFLCAFEKLRKATISFVMSVLPSAWNNSAYTGRIFTKFGILAFFKNISKNSSFFKIW
jgi:hypothetical protein